MGLRSAFAGERGRRLRFFVLCQEDNLDEVGLFDDAQKLAALCLQAYVTQNGDDRGILCRYVHNGRRSLGLAHDGQSEA